MEIAKTDMEIVIASNNRGKINEISTLLKGLKITILSLEDISFKSNIIEDGNTYEENALKKAKTIYDLSGKITIADDSGIEIDVLKGDPGIRSKRYFGDLSDYKRNQKMLGLLKEVPKEKRAAQYRCVSVLYYSPKEYYSFEGICKGMITKYPDGENGFGYDPIFYLPELGKTMAQIDEKTKNICSHRGKAFLKLKHFLKDRI